MADLIERLREGCVEHPRRWSGDTHDDLGGSIDEAATNALMAEAAAALEAAREDGWQPIETIPAMTHVLLMHPNYGGMGKPCMTWEFSGDARGFREDGYTHWHPAPKPPAIDQARGKGGGE